MNLLRNHGWIFTLDVNVVVQRIQLLHYDSLISCSKENNGKKTCNKHCVMYKSQGYHFYNMNCLPLDKEVRKRLSAQSRNRDEIKVRLNSLMVRHPIPF